MKRKILNFIIFLFVIISLFHFSCASTETLERPDSGNLGVIKNIDINSSNRYDIINTPYVDADEKIYDFADLFTDEEEDKLYDSVKKFIDENNIDMGIVTIDSNNKSSARAYADDFIRYNDFGKGNYFDGIVFLIDMDTRDMSISTYGNIIDSYQPYVEKVFDNCSIHIANEEYYKCANSFIESSEQAIDKINNKKWLVGFGIAIGASLLIPTIFCLVNKAKHKNVKLATHADTYLDKSSVKITHSNDVFIRSHTSRTAKASSSSSGGSRGRWNAYWWG